MWSVTVHLALSTVIQGKIPEFLGKHPRGRSEFLAGQKTEIMYLHHCRARAVPTQAIKAIRLQAWCALERHGGKARMRMREAKSQGGVGSLSDMVQPDFSDLYRGCSDLKVLVRFTHREGRKGRHVIQNPEFFSCITIDDKE